MDIGARLEALPWWVWLGAGIFVQTLIVMPLMYRHRKGRFKVLQEDGDLFCFRSNFGEITIHRRSVIVHRWRKDREILFSQIRRLEYGWRTTAALMAEIYDGVSLWDLSGKYTDVTNWYQLSLVLHGGQRVPLYLIGQYEPRELWSEWWFELQRCLLGRLGLYDDVEKTAQAVLEKIQCAFARHGKPLSLT